VDEAAPAGNDGTERRARWWHYLLAVGAAVAIALLLRFFVFQASWVPTGSMRPTLLEGDFLLINRLAYLLREPRRGEVIVFSDGDVDYVKRVLAVPGDEYRFADGYLWVNGERLDERPYLADGAWGHTRGLHLGGDVHRVPADCYLALGDNRLHSRDSRSLGYVRREEILGKAFLIYLSVRLGELGEAGWWATPFHLRLDRMLDVVR
jgi:signal peptidase I